MNSRLHELSERLRKDPRLLTKEEKLEYVRLLREERVSFQRRQQEKRRPKQENDSEVGAVSQEVLNRLRNLGIEI